MAGIDNVIFRYALVNTKRNIFIVSNPEELQLWYMKMYFENNIECELWHTDILYLIKILCHCHKKRMRLKYGVLTQRKIFSQLEVVDYNRWVYAKTINFRKDYKMV